MTTNHTESWEDIIINMQMVTPDMARDMLEANQANRNLRRSHMLSLSRDLKAGNFFPTAEPVMFAEDGTLLNGQHRLMAIIEAGTPAPLAVARNVPKAAQAVMDSGAKRSTGDNLRMQGVKYPDRVAQAARLVLRSRTPGMSQNTAITNSEIYDLLDEYPELHRIIARVGDKVPSFMRAYVSATYLIAVHTGGKARADQWLHHWLSGFGSEGNPCIIARNKLMSYKVAGKNLSVAARLRLVIWSWLKFANGDVVKAVRVPDEIKIPGWTKRND